MRKGFTTGTVAAGAVKAAVIMLKTGIKPAKVEIKLPDGTIVILPIVYCGGLAGIVKDAGDDPDITDRLLIQAGAKLLDNTLDIIIKGGKGVVIVTRKGLQTEVGETTINPVPKKMIRRNVEDVLKVCMDAEITIIVTEGREVAKKTFNECLGIVGGISIIGTTGIVTPMSVDALKATIAREIDIAVANGSS